MPELIRKNTPTASDWLRFPCCGHEHIGTCLDGCTKCKENAEPAPETKSEADQQQS